MKKRIITVLLVTACAAALAGCSSKKAKETEPVKVEETAAAREEAQTEAAAVETEAKAVETEAEAVETEAKAVETEAEAVETEAKAAETEAEKAETEAKAAETEAEKAETEAEVSESEYGYDFGETESEYDYTETEEEIEIIPKPVIAVGDYLKIEDDTYKTMTVEVEPAVQVTDQEVMDNISESFTYLDDYDDLVEKRTDGVVNDGDTVNIDYVGKKDGEAFDGGTATGYDLTIGSNTFIDGFEEGLIGKKIGDTVDLNLTFPEEYGVEELNGADVVFTVTINYAAEMPELTDELADKLSDGEYETVDEYKESIRSELQASNDETYQNAVYGAIMDKLIAEYPIEEYPEEAKSYYAETIIKNYIEPYAQMYGMELDEFVSAAYGGLTMDELKEQQINPEAEHMAQQELILGAIAEKEGITMTDEELDEVIKNLADQYGTTAEDILKYEDKEYIRMSELDRKVMEWLAVNVNVKDAAPETEAEAGAETEAETQAAAAETEAAQTEAEETETEKK